MPRSSGDLPATPLPSAASTDELGAHVSTSGGVHTAPARATEIAAAVLQLFTKQPHRWAEPKLSGTLVAGFREARVAEGVRTCVSHDSYLINLASPDPTLRARSLESFREELRRCERLGVDALVTHPGNATDGDVASGIERNAEALAAALEGVPGPTRVLLELTAGGGTTVGGRFEHLAGIREAVPAPSRDRVGVCMDTCHLWATGYDIVDDWEGVWAACEEVLPLRLIEVFHVNDTVDGLGSRRDRHKHVGEGRLERAFRRLMTDERFAGVPKIIETPKDGDATAADRRNLARLRSYRAAGTR